MENDRRQAAKFVMEQFARNNGFEVGEIREIEDETQVRLISAAPDGREFGVGYVKANKPTA